MLNFHINFQFSHQKVHRPNSTEAFMPGPIWRVRGGKGGWVNRSLQTVWVPWVHKTQILELILTKWITFFGDLGTPCWGSKVTNFAIFCTKMSWCWVFWMKKMNAAVYFALHFWLQSKFWLHSIAPNSPGTTCTGPDACRIYMWNICNFLSYAIAIRILLDWLQSHY